MLLSVNFSESQGVLLVLIPALCWLILILAALYHISRKSRASTFVKVLWFIIILLAPFLGSLIYLMWGKNKNF